MGTALQYRWNQLWASTMDASNFNLMIATSLYTKMIIYGDGLSAYIFKYNFYWQLEKKT